MPSNEAHEGVGSGETGPGEVRDLDRDVVALDLHEVDRLGDVLADDGGGGNVDKVDAEDLADERERATGAEVALDDLEHRVLVRARVALADDLHVERARDLKCLGDLLGNLLEAREVVVDERERRTNENQLLLIIDSL